MEREREEREREEEDERRVRVEERLMMMIDCLRKKFGLCFGRE